MIQIVGDAMAIPLRDALRAHPGRWNLASVINLGSGGAVFSESKQAKFREHFPNVMITNSFGSSEGGQMGMDKVGTLRWDGAVAQARMDNLLSANYTDKKVHGVLAPYDGLSRGIMPNKAQIAAL